MPQLKPLLVGTGIGLVDGYLEKLDDRAGRTAKGMTKEYGAFFPGALLVAGAVGEFGGFLGVDTTTTLYISSLTLLSREIARRGGISGGQGGGGDGDGQFVAGVNGWVYRVQGGAPQFAAVASAPPLGGLVGPDIADSRQPLRIGGGVVDAFGGAEQDVGAFGGDGDSSDGSAGSAGDFGGGAVRGTAVRGARGPARTAPPPRPPLRGPFLTTQPQRAFGVRQQRTGSFA